jgi:hypothetical protein
VPAGIVGRDADVVGAEQARDALHLFTHLDSVGNLDLLRVRRRIGADEIPERIDAVVGKAALDHKIRAHPAGVAEREVLDAVAVGLPHAEAGLEQALETVDRLLGAHALVPLRARVDVVALVEALEILEHLEAAVGIDGLPHVGLEAERAFRHGLIFDGQAIRRRCGHSRFLPRREGAAAGIILTIVQ